jgi:myosin heavy subunit
MDVTEPGVADCVLLQEISNEALLKNIQERFQKDRIYVNDLSLLNRELG